MLLPLSWPLGFKVDKMWFSVLKGKKGGQELTLKCVPGVRSLHTLPLANHNPSYTEGKKYHQSHAVTRVFQHIGKVADLTWQQQDSV